VFLANFFLFTYELDFVEKVISGNLSDLLPVDDPDNTLSNFLLTLPTTPVDILKHFLYTKRYLDDILSLNNPLFEHLKALIYPQDMLTLNEEHSGKAVTFLDTCTRIIGVNHPSFRCTLFDKRTTSKYSALPMSKYPAIDSFIPAKHKYNIVISQCYRFMRRCQSRKAFVYFTAGLIKELKDKGYVVNRLFNKLRTFLKNNLPFLHSFSVYPLLYKVKRRLVLLDKTGIVRVNVHVKEP
jgi:hypothetical protein